LRQTRLYSSFLKTIKNILKKQTKRWTTNNCSKRTAIKILNVILFFRDYLYQVAILYWLLYLLENIRYGKSFFAKKKLQHSQ